MSTLIALKLNGTALLATDSRVYNAQTGHFVSDAAQKLWEVSPGVFYASSGYTYLGDSLARIAATLGRTAQTGNIREFADQMDAAAMPDMERLVCSFSVIGQHQDELSGNIPFFMYALAGVSEGCPGFLFRQFWIRSGKIRCEEEYTFGSSTFRLCISGGSALGELVSDPASWADGSIAAAEIFVRHLAKIDPLVGGPTQIALVDRSGGRWVHQLLPPTWKPPADSSLADQNTIRPVSIFSTNPTLPDANYPAGSFGYNISGTPAFMKVNAAGTAWVLAINGGTDIQAGTITATQIDATILNAAQVAAAYVTASYLTANYITAGAIAAAYATFSYLSANYITASSIAATYITAGTVSATYATISALAAKTIAASSITTGTCSASVSFTAPTIKVTSGSLVIDLAASISSPVGTITGTMVSHVSGGSITDAILTSAYAVMACTGNGTSGQNSYLSQAGFYTSNGASTDAFLGPSELMVTGLPSSNPGTGSKKFWYDPSDGNRVKFAA
jgi:hypothetical protein